MLRRAATLLFVCGSLAASPEHSAKAGSASETDSPPTHSGAEDRTEHAVPEKSESTSELEKAAAGPAAESPGHGTPSAVHNDADGTTLTRETELQHTQIGHDATAAEIASLLRLGRGKREAGDFASSEIAYMQVLAEHATLEQDREAILGLARTYRKKGDFTKSAASYERFVKDFPADQELPVIYLELGRTLRALGAYKQAIARFYAVLNTTLKLPDQGPDQYRQLVRTAQYEIADTYFQAGDYVQANRFFSRLKLLDLAPEDRARAHFKSAVALSLAGEDEKAVVTLRAFLDQNHEDENVPEAEYLLSTTLRRLGQPQESLRVTLDLLRAESKLTEKSPQRWQHWQRKTGNQLANQFYESGDIQSALLIYTSLSQLSADPAWSLPVTYQLGLCHERLRNFEKARDCYKTIVDTLKGMKTDNVRPDLADLVEMAEWRLSQLTWQATTDAQLSAIFPPAAPHPPAPPTKTLPVKASASDHDVHGSAPIASTTMR